MAAKKSTTQARPARNPAASHPATARKHSANPVLKPDPALPGTIPVAIPEAIPETIEDAIEMERARLMKAETILQCILIAMDENDGFDRDDDDDDDEYIDVDGPHYPTLIEMARELMNQSIRGLDAVNLTSKAQEIESDEGDAYGMNPAARGKHEVREPYLPYFHQTIVTTDS